MDAGMRPGAAAPPITPFSGVIHERVVSFGRFGDVTIYQPSANPAQVALFVSGDGGWNLGVIDMARELARMDALVVGIDIRHYLRELEISSDKCSYPASDLEALSQFVQKSLNMPEYHAPVLVGYSSGATLVYATIVQAPPSTFRGAISMGFCPDLPVTKPFCKGSGLTWGPGPEGKGVSFNPAPDLEVPWVAFQGEIDQVCDPPSVRTFAAKVAKARVIMLPKVGHGFSVTANWVPQFRGAFESMTAASDPTAAHPSAPAVADLPVIEMPATAAPKGGAADVMAIHLTGDGGWGVTDKGVVGALVNNGIPVAVLNSLHYFWHRKTPDETAADIAKMISHYEATWGRKRVVLIGYSFGADALPFIINRLPEPAKSTISGVVLIGPSTAADFQVHVTDWLGSHQRSTDQPVLPEALKLKGMRILAFHGSGEKDSLVPLLPAGYAQVIETPGGHRIGGNYDAVARAIVDFSSGASVDPR